MSYAFWGIAHRDFIIMNMISGVINIKGKVKGKNLAVISVVHGTEICGVAAIKNLLPNINIIRGTVTFIFANEKAIRDKKRFVDKDLNRLFVKSSQLSSEQKRSYEYQRARELKGILRKCNALLDIHSSATPKAKPFVICEPRSFKVARYLPFSIVSNGWDKIQHGGTDYFVNKNGGQGICVECGYNFDPSAIKKAKSAVLSFLKYFGAVNGRKLTVRKQKLFTVKKMYMTKQNFKPAKHFKDFEFVKEGSLIGFDGGVPVKIKSDGGVVFVRGRTKPKEEAFLFGTPGKL